MLAGPPNSGPTSRGAADSWNPRALAELSAQLEKAGYTVAGVSPDSAELVGQLFRDVLKGAKYGKTARHLIESRNERIRDLESQLNKTTAGKPADPTAHGTPLEKADDEHKHRVYRLLYLASTAVELLSHSQENRKVQSDLLSALLEKDKTGAFGPRGELGDYWRVVSERDQLRAECVDKDQVIADLLSSGDESKADVASRFFTSSRVILSMEESLVKSIQSLKNATSAPTVSPEYEEERRKLEAELRHVEKTFAQHLKQCELADNESTDLGVLKNARLRLQKQLDQRVEENKELLFRINVLEQELVQKEKVVETLRNDGQQFKEELEALVTRCDLFETEFSQVENQRIEDDRKMKMMEAELADVRKLRSQMAELEAALETAQLSFINTDRALADAKDEINLLHIDITKLTEQLEGAEAETQKAKKQATTAASNAEKLNQTVRDLRNKLREKELEVARLQQTIETEQKELAAQVALVEQLELDLKKAQDNEDAAVLEKEEALKLQEQYKVTLKQTKKRLDSAFAENNELKNRNRFLITQVAEKIAAPLDCPDTILKVQRDLKKDHDASSVSEVAGLRLENKLLREKLSSNSIMLQKAINARKEAQALAADESLTVAKLRTALEEMSDRNLTNSFPPNYGSRRNSVTLGPEEHTAAPRRSVHSSYYTTSEPPSLAYPTSSEGFTNYTSATSFSAFGPSTTSVPEPSVQYDKSPTFESSSARGATSTCRAHFGSSTGKSFPTLTPGSIVTSSTDQHQPKSVGPTPIPVSRSTSMRRSAENPGLSYAERAKARIQQIMEEAAEDESEPEEEEEEEEEERGAPAPTTSRRDDDEDDDTPRHTDRQMTSCSNSTRGRNRLPYLNDEDYGHGGGYYWSPPREETTMSGGSLTYTNLTTNRSHGPDTAGGKHTLIDGGWITERTTST